MEQQQTEQQQEKCPAGIHLDILSDGGNIKNQSQITPLNIGLGAFSGSGTSQLGLSFVSQQVFPSKGDHEKHHHTSLFEDDSDGLLEVWLLVINNLETISLVYAMLSGERFGSST